MSHKKFDDNARSVFDEINDQDIPEVMLGKEAIWDSLDINKKKTNPYSWLMWIILGLLLVFGGMFINERFIRADKAPEIHFADADTMKKMEMQIASMKGQLDKMNVTYLQKDGLIDSLHLTNQKMQQQIELLASKDASISASEPIVLNIRDTIYLKEFEKENIILEKIIRDTVFIEVPVSHGFEELMVDNGTNDKLQLGNLTAGTNDMEKKTKPTSIQFNFSEIKNENK